MKNIEFFYNELLKAPSMYVFCVDHGMDEREFEKCTNNVIKWLNEEYSILDNTEKRYIGNIIRPLKTEHTYLKKEYCDLNGAEFIRIGGLKGYREDDTDCIELPFFKAGTMYKRMELDRLYTLEELGL